MKFSRLSLIFCGLLIVSVGAKIMLKYQPKTVDMAIAESRFAGLLAEKGYRVSVERRRWSPLIFGQKADCRLLVVNYANDGAFRDRIAQLAQPIGPLRYAYRGQLTAQPPKLDPFLRDKIITQIRQLGFKIDRVPITAIAASPGCNLQEIDWSRLASMP